MITEEQRALRNAIVNYAEKNNPDLDPHTASLIRVLVSVIEGVPVERALGGPGDWGYGQPIGDELLAWLKAPEARPTVPTPARPEPGTRRGGSSELVRQLIGALNYVLDEDDSDELHIEIALSGACWDPMEEDDELGEYPPQLGDTCPLSILEFSTTEELSGERFEKRELGELRDLLS